MFDQHVYDALREERSFFDMGVSHPDGTWEPLEVYLCDASQDWRHLTLSEPLRTRLDAYLFGSSRLATDYLSCLRDARAFLTSPSVRVDKSLTRLASHAAVPLRADLLGGAQFVEHTLGFWSRRQAVCGAQEYISRIGLPQIRRAGFLLRERIAQERFPELLDLRVLR